MELKVGNKFWFIKLITRGNKIVSTETDPVEVSLTYINKSAHVFVPLAGEEILLNFPPYKLTLAKHLSAIFYRNTSHCTMAIADSKEKALWVWNRAIENNIISYNLDYEKSIKNLKKLIDEDRTRS